MHPIIYESFRSIVAELKPKGRILEIGAVPNDKSLLTIDGLHEQHRIGINLNAATHYKGFDIVQGNANSMPMFEDGSFDCILSNATIEHDPFFWKTCAEMRRVLRSDGLAIIGAPGFAPEANVAALELTDPWGDDSHREWKTSTLTLQYHAAPNDYYRFGEAAFREVILEGFRDVTVKAIMIPPRFIAYGRKIT